MSITQAQTPTFPLSCVTLSTEFLTLTAAHDDDVNILDWQVSGEGNTVEYIVDRSVDGINFTTIGHVPYKVRMASVNQYEFRDNDGIPGTGLVYYRIREVEGSGKDQYSRIVSVLMNGLAAKLSVFPNPVKTTATVSFTAKSNGEVSLRLFDLKGSQLWTKQYTINAGANSILLDQLVNVPNGLYILQWFDGLKPQQVKLVVNH